jgi:hypothetical protein
VERKINLLCLISDQNIKIIFIKIKTKIFIDFNKQRSANFPSQLAKIFIEAYLLLLVVDVKEETMEQA